VRFRYFAYGSNMWTPRIRERCPSARRVGTAVLAGWHATYDKPSTDGSAKLNIRPHQGRSVPGVIYEIEDHERADLDAAEPRYTPIETHLGLAYAYEGAPATVPPAAWYVALVEAGARAHGLEPPASGHA
jgi:cation transport regulator ChaC